MQAASLTLQPHKAKRPTRAHEDTVVGPASNRRWTPGGFEIPCRNGGVVRVAFATDTHDREVMAWVAAAGAGINGEMARGMVPGRVESRFGAVRAPRPVRWPADDGSAYTASETVDFAATLNLVACFTPVRAPEGTASARRS